MLLRLCEHMACCYLHQLCHCFVCTVRCLTPAVCKSKISTVDRCHSCCKYVHPELYNRQIRELAESAALMILSLLMQTAECVRIVYAAQDANFGLWIIGIISAAALAASAIIAFMEFFVSITGNAGRHTAGLAFPLG